MMVDITLSWLSREFRQDRAIFNIFSNTCAVPTMTRPTSVTLAKQQKDINRFLTFHINDKNTVTHLWSLLGKSMHKKKIGCSCGFSQQTTVWWVGIFLKCTVPVSHLLRGVLEKRLNVTQWNEKQSAVGFYFNDLVRNYTVGLPAMYPNRRSMTDLMCY